MRSLNVRNTQFAVIKSLQDPDLATTTDDTVIHVHEAQAAEYVIRNVTAFYNLLLKSLKPFKPNVILDIHVEVPLCAVKVEEIRIEMTAEAETQAEGAPVEGEETVGKTSVEAEAQARGQTVEGEETVEEPPPTLPTAEEERAALMEKKEQRRLDYEAAMAAREAEEKVRAGRPA